MSELKTFTSERIYWAVEQVERKAGDIADIHLDDNLFYLKSEADKVIADLEESNKMEVEQLLMEIVGLKEKLKNSRNARKYWRKEYLIEYKECCSQKYKRCLAMAGLCDAKADWYYSIGENFRDCVQFNIKWRDKWLELAEKFKEAK